MSEKNNDFEFISKKFEEENITAPDGLSEDAVKEKLNKGEGKIIPVKTKTPWFKSAVAIAACFAIIAVSAGILSSKTAPRIEQNTPAPASVEGIVTYKSYDELSEALKKMEAENPTGYVKNYFGIAKSSAATDSAESAADGETVGAAQASGENFAVTNKQVDSVDEADIIKTDGRYIYYVADYERSEIVIFSAVDGKTEVVSKITPKGDATYFSEIFINGDKLIATGSRTDYKKTKSEEEDEDADSSEMKDGVYYNYFEGETYTFIYTYDISNREEPKLVDKYEQSGNYSSSRMIGSCVYIVSGYGNYYYNGLKGTDVPCATGEDGNVDKIAINDICSVENTKTERYSIIGAVDVESKDRAKKTKAILGVNDKLYCNENNLYLTCTNYKDENEYTRIVKYSLDGTNIKLIATGNAKGSVNDQFSMDEKDGNLRIALTDYRLGEGKDRNYLYVMNENLDIIGKTEGFAKNEHIEAVRFMGDTAYVITYEQTDPLFIIDLTNPNEPRITGEVKIDGFSSFLTPVDENTLLGIGFATSEEEWGIVQDGLKFALFDISDKNAPKVLDEYELKDYESDAQYNHKALTINKEDGYWAIPFERYDYDDEAESGCGAMVIRVDGNKISVKKYATADRVNRCTYIGKHLYSPDCNGKTVYSFEIK